MRKAERTEAQLAGCQGRLHGNCDLGTRVYAVAALARVQGEGNQSEQTWIRPSLEHLVS